MSRSGLGGQSHKAFEVLNDWVKPKLYLTVSKAFSWMYDCYILGIIMFHVGRASLPGIRKGEFDYDVRALHLPSWFVVGWQQAGNMVWSPDHTGNATQIHPGSAEGNRHAIVSRFNNNWFNSDWGDLPLNQFSIPNLKTRISSILFV